MTLHTTPANATHWSQRLLADHLGIDKSMVERVWKQHKLQPHRVKTFKLSRDKQFVEKLIDVVGLYLRPPEHALVLCADEKSQIQALDRTQPGLPLTKGRCGTTTLFAAIEMVEGKLIGQCMPRHRHQEFLKFLRLIDRQTPHSRAPRCARCSPRRRPVRARRDNRSPCRRTGFVAVGPAAGPSD